MTTNQPNLTEAVLPLGLFGQLRSVRVMSCACDKSGEALTSLRSYKGRGLRSKLFVWIVSDSEELVHRCAALLLLQVGGKASFSRSRNFGGYDAYISLPASVNLVVKDC